MDIEIKEDNDSMKQDEDPSTTEVIRRLNSPKNHQQLSWSELRTLVTALRKQLSCLSTMVPSCFTFRKLQDGRMRIYFLSTPQNGWETTLLFTDIPTTNKSSNLRFQWQCVLEANFPALSSCNKSSREEQLLCERKRLTTWGINSYEIHETSGKIVFPVAGNLFQCVDTGFTNGHLFPTKLRMASIEAKLSPQICPSNPELVAYICNHDIWVTHTVSGSNVRITYAHKGGRNLADDPFSAGVPSYVMQEEFCRYDGYWWQPISLGSSYRILYEEVDDSDVKLLSFPSSQSESGEVEEFRFPRAGSSNSKSYLKLVEFKLNEHLQIVDLSVLDLQFSLNVMFPWMEYIARAGWTPDGEFIWVQLLDRRQQHLEIILLSPDAFGHDISYMNHLGKLKTPSGSPIVQVVYSQDSKYWINVHDLLHFFPSDNFNEIKFIWANEDSGYRHLYLVTSQIFGNSNGLPEGTPCTDYIFLAPKILSKIQLTSGDWEVLGENLWLNHEKNLVYFMALRETPLEKHLYVVSLKQPEEIRLLTRPGYSYAIEFDKERSLLVSLYSNVKQPPACQIFRVSHTDWTVDGVNFTPIGYLIENTNSVSDCYCPDIYTHKIASGNVIYAMVFKPHDFQTGQKYPVVLNVYGGPEVQMVSNSFKGMRQLRMHMLAALGYCVIAIDSRGSFHRGIEFEGYIKGRMGTVELDDQVEVLQWLSDNLGYIDMKRVAIHGWSYGGYLSLMGLIHHPDIFKVAIAGAPVTNWTLYDTGYTERYMDLPIHNPDGYNKGSVLNHVHKLPDEENRLLIIHGLIDENVHFHHTTQLINSMIVAGKPYQLQIYPGERHSLRHLDSSKHYETGFLSFLQNNL